MNARLHHIALVALGVLSLGLAAAGADDINAMFHSLYGSRIHQVKATDDRMDDLGLARELVADARKVTQHPMLVFLMCRSARELSTSHYSGRGTAIEAMELVYRGVPDKAEYALKELIALYQLQYGISRGEEKKQVGRKLLDAFLTMADRCEGAGGLIEANKYYNRAALLASSVDPTIKAEIQEKSKALAARMAAQRKIDRCVSQLKVDPDDIVTRTKVIMLYVVEMDDPAGAMNFYTDDLDEVTRTYMPLSARQPSEVAVPACFELGQWYRSLSRTAPSGAKPAMLRRAQRYYRRFLDAPAKAGQDTQTRFQAQMGLRYVEAELAKLARWTNLLPLVDPRKHTLAGIWKAAGGQLGTDTENVSGIAIPVRPTGNYEIEIGFKRMDGNNGTVLNLPVGDNAVALVLSGQSGDVTGLGLINDVGVHQNPTLTKIGVLANKKLHSLAVKVVLSGDSANITARLNNSKIIDWNGQRSALSLARVWPLPGPMALGIAAHEITLVVHTLKLRALSDQLRKVTRSEIEQLRTKLGYDPERALREEEERQRRLKEMRERRERERRLRELRDSWWDRYRPDRHGPGRGSGRH